MEGAKLVLDAREDRLARVVVVVDDGGLEILAGVDRAVDEARGDGCDELPRLVTIARPLDGEVERLAAAVDVLVCEPLRRSHGASL